MIKSGLELTHLTLTSPRVASKERLLILADLHQQTEPQYADEWLSLSPQAILIPGDFLEWSERPAERDQTLALLERLAEQVPTFYTLGNHELGLRGNRLPTGEGTCDTEYQARAERFAKDITNCGAQLLRNEYTHLRSLCIGGLTPSGGSTLDTAWLDSMANEEGFRLLLCHHPEYYEPYVQRHGLDLTVAGHAHGGQWRVFGRGVYAPGQGLFPRYTSGLYDENRLLVSRGLSERMPFPRVFNKRQAILLTLVPQ